MSEETERLAIIETLESEYEERLTALRDEHYEITASIEARAGAIAKAEVAEAAEAEKQNEPKILTGET